MTVTEEGSDPEVVEAIAHSMTGEMVIGTEEMVTVTGEMAEIAISTEDQEDHLQGSMTDQEGKCLIKTNLKYPLDLEVQLTTLAPRGADQDPEKTEDHQERTAQEKTAQDSVETVVSPENSTEEAETSATGT